MAKELRWKVKFQSNQNKTNYEIRIFDDSTNPAWISDSEYPYPAVEELKPGSNPIITNEDDSDDFFTPLRKSTGTIQVVCENNKLMERIMPGSNTERPVKLVSIAANNTETLQWQGFLSCEAYSQSYTGITKLLELNIISPLEALNSIDIQTEDIYDYITIKTAIRMALIKLTQNFGMPLYTYVYFPKVNYEILNKYMDPSVMVTAQEKANEESIDYIYDGLSFNEIVKNICTLMGWCVREQGSILYFMPISHNTNDNLDMVYQEYETFYSNTTFSPQGTVSVSKVNISSSTWMGTDHTKSVEQGAKSVEVVAEIKRFDTNMKLPECPNNNLTQKNIYIDGVGYGSPAYLTITSYLSSNITFNSLIDFKSMHVKANFTPGGQNMTSITYIDQSSVVEGITNWNTWNRAILPTENRDCYYFACMCRATDADFDNILLIAAGDKYTYTPGGTTSPSFAYTTTNYIFHMRSATKVIFSSGLFKLSLTDQTSKILSAGESEYEGSVRQKIIPIAIKFGDKYWNGSGWQNGLYVKNYEPDNDGNLNVDILINQLISGYVELFIYHGLVYNAWDYEAEEDVGNYMAVITKLELKYEANDTVYQNDRSENTYYQRLNTKFSDIISIRSVMSSNLNNNPSPSLVLSDNTGLNYMSTFAYNKTSGTEERRPEKDLLERLAKYYGKVRRKLELICEHSTEAALPLLQIDAKGQNNSEVLKGYDGKLYLPLAESRDWQQDTSTITCFETPDGDE